MTLKRLKGGMTLVKHTVGSTFMVKHVSMSARALVTRAFLNFN